MRDPKIGDLSADRLLSRQYEASGAFERARKVEVESRAHRSLNAGSNRPEARARARFAPSWRPAVRLALPGFFSFYSARSTTQAD